MKLTTSKVRWCENCNVPLLGDSCNTCGSKGFYLKVRKPADLRPVFEEEKLLLISSIDNQYGKGSGKMVLYENHLVFMNKIFYIDQAYEVISDGKLLGHFFFDVFDYRWTFKPLEYGCFRIFKNLGIGVKRDGLRRDDIIKFESSFDERMKFVPVVSKGCVYGVAQILSKNEARVLKTFEPICNEVKLRESSLEDVLKSNLEFIRKKESKAVTFIHKLANRIKKPVCVSYSGGKDSLAVLLLSLEAGLRPKVSFTNTGIELPETLENVVEVSKKLNLELLFADANESFWNGIEVFGIPARDYRWCCKICKLIPTAKLYKKEFPEGSLTLVGQRALESRARARTGNVWKNYWIPNSISASPINDWNMLTVWLYIIYKNAIDLVNKAYFYGFDRVGCYLCPSCSISDFLLVKEKHPEIWKKFEEKLIKFVGNSEHLKYHLWRWKRVPKKIQKVASNVSLQKHPAYTLNKKEEGFEVVVRKEIDSSLMNELIKTVEVSEDTKIIFTDKNTVTIRTSYKNELNNLIAVILRAAYCQKCGSCEVWCPYNAITIKDNKLYVNENACKKCGLCNEKCPVVEYLL